MNINKEASEDRVYYVGNGNTRILAINPSNEQKAKMFGSELDESKLETEYCKQGEIKIGEESEVVDQAGIWVYVQEQKTKKITPIIFNLANHTANPSKEGKKLFLNSLGGSCYAMTDNDLPDWFTSSNWIDKKTQESMSLSRDVREAYIGEKELYAFLQQWIQPNGFSSEDGKKCDQSLFLDLKKVFNGNFKELQDLLKNDVIAELPVICAFGVKTKDDGSLQQAISNKFFLKGSEFTRLNNFSSKLDGVEVIAALTGKKDYDLKRFSKDVNDAEHGYAAKVFYQFCPIKQYNPDENPVATDSAVVNEDTHEEKMPWEN